MIPALILARGGSKGIPGKNRELVDGLPLVCRAVNEAKASRFDPVYVYSDDEEIRYIAAEAGAKTPVRPPEVSQDETTSETSVATFVRREDKDAAFKAVALIQCTTPFLTRRHLDEVHQKWATGSHDSVITACSVTQRYLGYPGDSAEFIPLRPYRALRQQPTFNMWMENGGCYLASRELWLAGRRIGPRCGVVEMGWWESLEIDEPIDLEAARHLAKLCLPTASELPDGPVSASGVLTFVEEP
jgi:N-acylneuraminate cytidylyltransferase